jgi:hypothetical protein
MKAHKLTFNWRRQLANSVIATTDDSQEFSFARRLTDHRTVLPILHRFAQKNRSSWKAPCETPKATDFVYRIFVSKLVSDYL